MRCGAAEACRERPPFRVGGCAGRDVCCGSRRRSRARTCCCSMSRATDVSLRQEDCRANVLHTAPDRAMLADALAQYLVWKRWPRWLVAKGVFPEDLAYLDALRRAAKRFGGTIVEEREYKETPGRAPLRHRSPADPAADAGLYARRAELRRGRRGRRERGVRSVSALSHLGSAARCRHRGPQSHELASGARAMGGHADAESVRALRQALHAAARLSGVGRGAGASARRRRARARGILPRSMRIFAATGSSSPRSRARR